MAKIKVKGTIIPSDVQWIYDWFGMEATSPKSVSEAMEAAEDGEELEVEINSGGGSVFAGSEIYTMLMDYVGNVVVKVVGIAASAASVIAMAGNTVKISPTAQIMIHNVSVSAQGDYRDLRHTSDVIKNYNKSIANSYLLKTGMSQQELLGLMDKETWLNAQQAKEKGFADEVMFDTGNQLVASVDFGGAMLPQEVIDKIRNMDPEQLAGLKPSGVEGGASPGSVGGNPAGPEDNANELKMSMARLNLLKLKGEIV